MPHPLHTDRPNPFVILSEAKSLIPREPISVPRPTQSRPTPFFSRNPKRTYIVGDLLSTPPTESCRLSFVGAGPRARPLGPHELSLPIPDLSFVILSDAKDLIPREPISVARPTQ